MIQDEIGKKLQDIVNGVVLKGQPDHCTAIRNLLCQSFESGPTLKGKFEGRAILKKEQANFLIEYAKENSLWFDALPNGFQYLTRGGESKVYLAPDNIHVLKINDAIYYATWTEYFNSIVIHNLLFPNTTYSIQGFIENESNLSLILQQRFIEGGQADLNDIKELLIFNGFNHLRRQDYYNQDFGLLLEDMHDENVIAKDNVLFFIDTVFYLVDKESLNK